MMNSGSVKLAAVTAAAGYAISGAAVIGHRVPDQHWGNRGAIVDAAAAVAFALTAVALAGLGPRLSGTRLGRWSTRVAQVGLAGMTIESIASLAHGGNTLGPVFFAGLLLALGGLAVLAAAGVRADQYRWAAPMPALALLVGIAGGDRGGFVATGLVWLALAALVGRKRSAVPAPA